MLKVNLFNRLFFKLLFGFWLCSSLIIALILLLPVMLQKHEQAPLEQEFLKVLTRVADRLESEPELLTRGQLPRMARHHDEHKRPIRFYIVDQDDRVINARNVPRRFKQFLLMADEAKNPISHRSDDDIYFGPYPFTANGQTYQLYGKAHANRPLPWFVYLAQNKLLTAGIAILFSGLLCGLLAWHLGKPLNALRRSANTLAKGNLSHRVDKTTLARSDEMGQLAQSFNSMADAIEAMVNQQQRLMGDISHELRTPLTRLQLALALANKKGQQSTELERIKYEAIQLDELIGELLTLSRVTLNASDVMINAELSETLSQVLDDAEFEAEQQHKTLLIDIDDTLMFHHYPKHLQRAIENLLRNAIRYATSQIWISAKLVQDNIEIRIEDDGMGVDKQELEAIFRPFYRPDSARDRNTGGWGLGLAITQAAIKAHQGSIQASLMVPHGLSMKITLPMK